MYTITSSSGSGSLVISNVTLAMDGNLYRCLISGNCPPQISTREAALTINPIKITSQSNDTTVCEKNFARFVVKASGNGLMYTWNVSKDGGVTFSPVVLGGIYSGVNSDTLKISNATLDMHKYKYYCTVSGSCDGITTFSKASNVATLFINAASTVGVVSVTNSSICAGNFTKLIAKNSTGSIQWQQSVNGSNGWSNVSGGSKADSVVYVTPVLTQNMFYRVFAKSGVCKADTLGVPSKVSVTQVSLKGTVTAVQSPICINQPAQLKVTGSRGSIQWQQSSNNSSWNNVTGNVGPDSTLYTTNNLSGNTYFRILATNGVCSTDTSASIPVLVTPLSVSGTLTALNSVVCAKSSTTLKIKGAKGTVSWLQSSNGGAPWITPINGIFTDSSYTSGPLVKDVSFRAIIKNGVCDTVSSQIVKVSVNSFSQRGNLVADQSPICISQKAQLMVTGKNGSIQWEQSSDPSKGWSAIGSSQLSPDSTKYSSFLTGNTFFRVIVGNGVCPKDTSKSGQVEVTPTSVAGKLFANKSPICNNTTATLFVKGSRGMITWMQSGNGSSPWVVLNGKDSVLTTTPLLSETYYKVILKNGVCDTVSSDTVKISIFKPSITSIGRDTMICTEYGKPIVLKTDKPFVSYTWSDNSRESTLSVLVPGTYWVDVLDINGCKTRSSVKIDDCSNFFIPDIITPNGDKFNDNFVIIGHKPGSSLVIYNRWGTIVFQKDSYYNGEWDGGNEVAGNYLYIYTLNNEINKKVYTGWVTIMRDK
jgi:gliding motility-associated-like protein